MIRQGLNVSICTDDPLQFQDTLDPLLEEYTVSRKLWELSQGDVAEVARNSVRLSEFDHVFKQEWLGDTYAEDHELLANRTDKSNVSDIRCAFRFEQRRQEFGLLLQRQALHSGGHSYSDDIVDIHGYKLNVKAYLHLEQLERDLSDAHSVEVGCQVAVRDKRRIARVFSDISRSEMYAMPKNSGLAPHRSVVDFKKMQTQAVPIKKMQTQAGPPATSKPAPVEAKSTDRSRSRPIVAASVEEQRFHSLRSEPFFGTFVPLFGTFVAGASHATHLAFHEREAAVVAGRLR